MTANSITPAQTRDPPLRLKKRPAQPTHYVAKLFRRRIRRRLKRIVLTVNEKGAV
jgi:hypothetical protein